MQKQINHLSKLLFFTVFVLYSINLNAQSRLGIKGGLNLSNIGGESTFDFGSRLAPAFGIFVDIPLSGKLNFQQEILYSFQGAYISQKSTNTFTSTSKNLLSLQYLQIPFLAKLYLNETIHLLMGPQFSMLIDGRESGTNAGISFNNAVNNHLNDIDWSLIAGLGADVHPNVIIGFRINYGIRNLNSNSSRTLQSDKIYNRVVNFNLGYIF